VIENNHYFPAEILHTKFFRASDTHTSCAWKGIASYYSIEVGGEINSDAAWMPVKRLRLSQGGLPFGRVLKL
jgi:uncharacterized protein (DUF427 family)